MLTLDKIYHAAFVLKDVARKTDLIEAPKLSKDCQLYLKTENLQATGSFKVRGAYYKISQLSPEESAKGVIACSAGNHAQGVALAATRRGIKSIVCMPDGAPIMKVENTKNLGAEVCLVPGTYDDAHDKAVELQEETGMTFIHPYDDEQVIAGQGTIGLEILDQLPDLDAVLPLSFLTKMAVGKVLLQSLALELEKVLAQWSLMALTLQLSFLPGSELQLFPQPSFLPGYPWYLWMYSYFLFHPDDNKAPDPLWKCSGKSPLPLQVADSRSHGNHWSYRSARQRMNAIWHHAYQYFH